MTVTFLSRFQGTFKEKLQPLLYTGFGGRFFLGSATPDTLNSVIPTKWVTSDLKSEQIIMGQFKYAHHKILLDPTQSLWMVLKGNSLELSSWFVLWLHSFEWLNDLIETGTPEALAVAKRHLVDWLRTHSSFDHTAWSLDVLSSRIVHWSRLYPLIKPQLSGLEEQHFLRNLTQQAVFLRKTMKMTPFKGHLVLYHIRSVMACLSIPDETLYVQSGLKTLVNVLTHHFLEGGEHISRNPSLQLQITYELQILIEALRTANLNPPTFLTSTIQVSKSFLKMLCHDDGGFAVFNGGVEEKDSAVMQAVFGDERTTILEDQVYQSKLGYVRLHTGEASVIADFGKGTAKDDYSHEAHAGLFAFEFSDKAQRIIVNCGIGSILGDDYQDGFRASQAHSTVSVEGNSIGQVDSSQKGGEYHPPSQVNHTVVKSGSGILLEGSHNGFAKKFGLVHRRRILLHTTGQILQGEDWLTRIVTPENKKSKKAQAEPVHHAFTVRFHLHPDVTATIVKGSVLIEMPTGRQWVLTPSTSKVSLEPSVYTGVDGKPKNCQQIVLMDMTHRQETKVRWALQSLQNTAKEKELPAVQAVENPQPVEETPSLAEEVYASAPVHEEMSDEFHDSRTEPATA